MHAVQAAEQGTLRQAIADRLVELAAVSDEPGNLTRLYLGRHTAARPIWSPSGCARPA